MPACVPPAGVDNTATSPVTKGRGEMSVEVCATVTTVPPVITSLVSVSVLEASRVTGAKQCVLLVSTGRSAGKGAGVGQASRVTMCPARACVLQGAEGNSAKSTVRKGGGERSACRSASAQSRPSATPSMAPATALLDAVDDTVEDCVLRAVMEWAASRSVSVAMEVHAIQ